MLGVRALDNGSGFVPKNRAQFSDERRALLVAWAEY
jgi:hypothetical protein